MKFPTIKITLFLAIVIGLSACGKRESDLCVDHTQPISQQEAFTTLDKLSHTPASAPMGKQARFLKSNMQAVTQKIFGRWMAETGYSVEANGKPRLIVTEIRNQTALSVTSRDVREALSSIAREDGRYNTVVATTKTQAGKAFLQAHLLDDPYYSNNSQSVEPAKALQCFVTVKLSEVDAPQSDQGKKMLIDLTLYDIETPEFALSDWDVLDADTTDL